MATQKEIGRTCLAKKYYDKAKVSLCGFSNGSIFIDGNLDELKKQAENEELSFYLLKGELKTLKESKNGTIRDNIQ